MLAFGTFCQQSVFAQEQSLQAQLNAQASEVDYEADTEDDDDDDPSDEEVHETERAPVKYDIIIVGGGTAGFSVLKELKKMGYQGEVLMVSDAFLQAKPPLTSYANWNEKNLDELSAFAVKASSEHYETFDSNTFHFLRADVIDFEPNFKQAMLIKIGERSFKVGYGHCVLATGSSPIGLRVEAPADTSRITHYDRMADFRTLVDSFEKKSVENVSILGGGFTGTELAYAIANKARESNVGVNLVVQESGVLRKYLPEYFSQHLTSELRKAGINVITNSTVAKISEVPESHRLNLSLSRPEGSPVISANPFSDCITDHLFVAIGATPEIQLAKMAGLEIDATNGGIVTNAYYQAAPNVWAIGDIASFYNATVGRVRVDHDENAKRSGKVVARCIAGDSSHYGPSYFAPKFRGELGTNEYFGYGRIDSSLETVSTWIKGPITKLAGEKGNKALLTHSQNSYEANQDFRVGLIYYLDQQKIVGVLGWNIDCYPAASVLAKKERKFETPLEVTRAISIHDLLAESE